MSKRKSMTAEAENVLGGQPTGGDALAAATQASEPEKKPAKSRTKKAKKVNAPTPPPASRYVVTTVRLEPEQWAWLREVALRRSLKQGGKADASAVLRELVAFGMEEWSGNVEEWTP